MFKRPPLGFVKQCLIYCGRRLTLYKERQDKAWGWRLHLFRRQCIAQAALAHDDGPRFRAGGVQTPCCASKLFMESANVSKARRLSGCDPQIPIEEGLQAFA